ncbi:helix-turn-helix transcriptional regulator [Collinsella tanakaei]|nr:helix-turn-helix transcriptional regulator [Collinsella tanakaei]
MSFRDNLQHLRASRNMTQEQLAMLLGVSRQSVTKWEAEKSYPEMDKLLKMCQIFDCTLDDLVQGDLTACEASSSPATVPAGPPTDICGYDEHQRMMAWKVPTGIAAILLGIAIGLFFEGAVELASVGARDGLFVIIVLAGVLAGLAFLIPAGMEHAAFQRAHPYVEDFYTEDDRLAARKAFSGGLIAGIAFIFAGIGCLIMLEKTAENIALFFLMFFIALGVWNITHYGMLLGRIDVAEYNRSVGEELEVEEIVAVELDDARREALLATKRADRKIGAICGAIMIVATIVGLGLLFAPVLTSANPDEFEPLGTSAAWFWVTWPVGGMICGIVTLLMRAFGKDE